LSHATFLDLPGQPRFLIVADAMLNVAPNLAAKKDIVLNTVQFANALGVASPHVALLAAKGTIAPAFASTSEAAALKSMGSQGVFQGALVDGPMTPDVALSGEIARQHGVKSDVAGEADVLIAPSMEAATMVTRTLIGLAGGLAAGLVLGARVPIVLTSQHDAMEVRIASCVLASLMVSNSQEAANTDGSPPAASSSVRAAA
jgi:phosphotransacetylase